MQAQARLDELEGAMPLLEEGARLLLSRDYPEAIKRYEEYLQVAPDSVEVYDFLGYADLRYAATLADDRQQAENYFDLAERNFRKSIALHENKPGKYNWASYNLVLLYYDRNKKEVALEQVGQLLDRYPAMVDWICRDGQFRKIRLDPGTGERFAALVDAAAGARQMASCWVTRPRR